MAAERRFTNLERRGRVAKIIFNRPEKRNALSRAALTEIASVLDELRNDDQTSVVLTTGAGDDAYCAGRDLKEFPRDRLEPDDRDTRFPTSAYVVGEMIRSYPKIVIAVVNGYCLGAGITLLLPHDLAIASEEKAKFGLPEVMRGFLPYPIAATIFKSLIPTKFGLEMILTGKNWDAKKALEVGLINKIVPHAQLQEAAWEWGEEIARWDRLTLQYCKKAANSSMETPSIPLAAELVWHVSREHRMMNAEAYEGMRAFLDRKELKATE
jgi:enoyl-CoA hydratase/carnithine racemase